MPIPSPTQSVRKLIPIIIAIATLSGAAAHAANPFPLRDVTAGGILDLSGDWRFRYDPSDAGARQEWFKSSHDRATWQTTPVPRGYPAYSGSRGFAPYRGQAWHSRTIDVPAHWTGDVLLYFLGAAFITDVWANGEYVGLHRGGYTPFAFDLTGLAVPGQPCELVVRVDNRLSGNSVPTDHTGWQLWGGLYREVFLIEQPRLRLEDVITSTSVPLNGPVQFHFAALAVNTSDKPYRGELLLALLDKTKDWDKRKALESAVPLELEAGAEKPIRLTLPFNDAKLWSPDDPFLYTLKAEWSVAGKRRQLMFRTGLREIRLDGEKILVNNRRLWLQGFGQHEIFKNATPLATREERLAQLRHMKDDFGCNTLRPGHYPNHPLLYDLCDELGLLVFSEIPAWQVSPYYMESSKCWETWLEPQLYEMVTSLRNHPCIAFWGVSNEIGGLSRYLTRSRDYIRTLDNTRPIAPVLASTEGLHAYQLADFGARNFHYGWYHSQSVYQLRQGLNTNLSYARNKPIWVAELGAHATQGRLSGGYGDHSRGSETYQDKVVRFGFQHCATATDKIAGISVWTWTDFIRSGATEPHGIHDLNETPKLVTYTLRNLYQGDLRLYICEDDTLCRAGQTWGASLFYFNPNRQARGAHEARYRILKGAKEVAKGSFKIPAIPAGARTGEAGRVGLRAPNDAQPGLYVLWAELYDEKGNWLYTNSCPFDVIRPSQPGILKVKALNSHDGQPVKGAYAELAGVRIPIYTYPGLLLPLEQGMYTINFKADGYHGAARQVEIAAGRPTEFTVDLAKE